MPDAAEESSGRGGGRTGGRSALAPRIARRLGASQRDTTPISASLAPPPPAPKTAEESSPRDARPSSDVAASRQRRMREQLRARSAERNNNSNNKNERRLLDRSSEQSFEASANDRSIWSAEDAANDGSFDALAAKRGAPSSSALRSLQERLDREAEARREWE